VAVAAVIAFFGARGLFGFLAVEQQKIWHVFAARAGSGDLLEGQALPAQQIKHFFDDVCFGVGFIEQAVRRKRGVNTLKVVGKTLNASSDNASQTGVVLMPSSRKSCEKSLPSIGILEFLVNQ